jgi:hypothetical protein
MPAAVLYRGRLAGIVLIPMGLYCLGLAAAIPFALKAPWLGFALMGVPLIFVGLLAILNGSAHLGTKIWISEENLIISAPTWRGCPLLPMKRINIPWDMVRAVRHRKELYSILLVSPFPLFAPFPVDAYALETNKERIILAGRSVRNLKQAIVEISQKSGHTVTEEKEIRVSIIRALIRGVPDW